jgi:hypothetical protein
VKAALNGGQMTVFGEWLDGVDAAAFDARCERQARQSRHVVDQDRASAAFAAVAAGFRSGQPDDFPQIIQEQYIVGNRIGAGSTVEHELKNARHAGLTRLNFADSIAITPKPFKPCPLVDRTRRLEVRRESER